MPSDRRIQISRLFIAIPELTYDLNYIDTLERLGLLSHEQAEGFRIKRRALRKAGVSMRRVMRNETLIRRMLAVVPELITVDNVNLLRAAGLLSVTEGHALRIAVDTLNAGFRGGLPTDKDQIFSRLTRVLGANVSYERIALWQSMGLITTQEAQRWRGYIKSGRVLKESVAKARRAKTLLDALLVIGEIPISKDTIDIMVKVGILSPRLGRTYASLIDLGVKEWKVFNGTRSAEGFRRRALLMLTGSLNIQLLDFLRVSGVITNKQWASLQIAEILSRRVNDRLLESLIKRRYRVYPGEAPIKTFAKASRQADGDLLQLLARAAEESRKEAAALAALGKAGANVRSRQYLLAARGLHEAMRSMWDGVGYLTIWGEREVAEAAAESAAMMQRDLLKGKYAKLGDSLLWQSKAGVDSYISRKENTLDLSQKVYRNVAFWTGQVDKRISLSLLRGQSAREIAAMVSKYISPDVPGGVSYAAMRLARTEINNAFHLSTIRFTRENPWVRGYKWNLSGSHPKSDICNEYASYSGDNLGIGGYKKTNVPGKPHPHCFCYITVIQMSPEEFVTASNAGRFDRWYKQVDSMSAYDAPDSASLSQYLQQGYGNVAAGLASR
jgi:hypothetical protein